MENLIHINVKTSRIIFWKSLFLTFVLLAGTAFTSTVSGQCLTGGSLGTFSPTGVFQTLGVAAGAPAYRSFTAIGGASYTFSYCQGGGSYTGDPYLTITNNTPTALTQNDDFCGLGSEITWTAPSTGTYRLYFSGCCPCNNAPSATLAYRCNSGCSVSTLIPYSGSNSIACGTNTALCSHAGCGVTYSNNANGYTVLTGGGSATITVAGSYAVESCCDRINIYNGVGTGGGLLAQYGSLGSGTFTYTGSPGQTLTVQFTSDVSVTSTGLNANVTYSGSCVTPPPTISSFSPTSACQGATVTINGSNFTGATAVSFGGTAAASFSVISSTQINAVVGAGTSGNVSVSTPSGSTSLGGFSFSIPSVAPTGITGNTVTCAGGSTTLSVSGGSLGTGASWNWFSSACGGTFLGTGSSISVSPGSTTSYFVRAQGSCNTTTCATTTVTVTPLPAAPTSVTATPSAICAGSTSNLSAISSGNNIQWYTVPSGGAPIGTVASGSNFAVSPGSTTTYYAEAVTTSGGGGGSQTFNFSGGLQTFTVPSGVTSVTIQTYGAQAFGALGGNGGYASGILAVSPGQVLNVYVGGQNGFNGGGNGYAAVPRNGGGASDVRVGGTALANRVIVAGGGGGGGAHDAGTYPGGVGRRYSRWSQLCWWWRRSRIWWRRRSRCQCWGGR